MLVKPSRKASNISIKSGIDMIEFVKNYQHFLVKIQVLKPRQAEIYEVKDFAAIVRHPGHLIISVLVDLHQRTAILELQGHEFRLESVLLVVAGVRDSHQNSFNINMIQNFALAHNVTYQFLHVTGVVKHLLILAAMLTAWRNSFANLSPHCR